MQNFILQLGVRFTDEEKKKCLPTAYRIINLAKTSHEQGILALESEILADDNAFLIMGVKLIADGIAPELTEKIFQHSIVSSARSGSDLLDRLLVSEGLLSIQSGLNPIIIAYILGAMLDEKYIPEMVSTAKQTIDIKNFLDSYFQPNPTLENSEFEKKLYRLTRTELSRVLVSMDCFTLAIAFHKCSKSFVYHMRNGVSENAFLQLCSYFSYVQSISQDEVLDAQNQVLYRLARLEDMGLIIYPADEPIE